MSLGRIRNSKPRGVSRSDVILLENDFGKFRETALAHYVLDPVHFYTLPGFAWKACLKKTKIKLKLLSDPDMLLMFESGIRGGITQAIHKYMAANNKYMKYYDPNQESTYIQYLDANNSTDGQCLNHSQLVGLNDLIFR